ncbi:MAG: putative LytR family regulatory protein [Ilumatobacteraceae bacterium]|nr:putative LytR family regulatory protein [Ilumatobacteraceae bacterium]
MGEAEIKSSPTPPPLKRGQRHPTRHFVVLVFNLVVALACFVGAGVLIIGQRVVTDTQKTSAIVSPTQTQVSTIAIAPAESTTPDSATAASSTGSTEPGETTTTEVFPDADPNAKNFLITGADNDACADAGSANPVPDRTTLGERSDTIMVMRVDPSTDRAAILSFPRDLYVKIHGTNGRNRINAAYSVNDPQKLIDTIYDNFFIPIDHYIQIDFCAFKSLVDAVGGVSVYFQYPARDAHTGLDVPVTDGCYTFNGDAALAYVRSRHYQYLDPKTGKFTEDPASDYGRISRQQDFLRRAVTKVLSAGYSVKVARSLIDVATKYVVVDKDLTLDKELQFAGVLKDLNPQNIQTYQVEGTGTVIAGASVIQPKLTGANMKSILAIFQGHAQLATAPDQVFDTTTTSQVPTTTTTPATSTTVTGTTIFGSPATTVPPTTTTTTTTPLPTTTLPPSDATEINKGIYPPRDKTCP